MSVQVQVAQSSSCIPVLAASTLIIIAVDSMATKFAAIPIVRWEQVMSVPWSLRAGNVFSRMSFGMVTQFITTRT